MSSTVPTRLALYALGGVALLFVAGVLAWKPALGVHLVAPGAPAPRLPERGFSHDLLAEVLAAHVTAAGVDYPALVARAEPLRRYAALLAGAGPRTAPERFPSRAEQLAYYINAYNALTLLGVVEHWPIASVHDVRGRIEPRPGLGFFWAQRFRLDGEETSLYELENKVLRPRFRDARVHAAINCASRSCPSLSPRPYRAATVEAQLAAAARAMCDAPRHVRVDDAARAIVLNAIFKWYAADFEAQAREQGQGKTVLDWIAAHASPRQAARLRRAQKAGYTVRHATYDWRLNLASPGGG